MGPLSGVAARITGLGVLMRNVGVAGGLMAGGFAASTLGASKSLSVLADYEQQMFRVEAVLRATDEASGQTVAGIDAFAKRLGRATLTSATEVRAAAGALATFKSVSEDAFRETLGLAQDLSAVFSQDLRQSTVQLGKALEDPLRGLTALRRVGVSFGATQRELIESFVEAGDEAAAQRVILDTLQQQVGGSGEAEAAGLAGSYDSLKEAIHDFGVELSESSLLAAGAKSVLDSLTESVDSLTFSLTPEADVEALDAQIERLKKNRENLFEVIDRRRGSASLFTVDFSRLGGGSFDSTEFLESQDLKRIINLSKEIALLTHRRDLIQDEIDAESDGAAVKQRLAELAADRARINRGLEKSHQALTKELERQDKIAARQAKAQDRREAALAKSILRLEKEAEFSGLTAENREVALALLQRELQVQRKLGDTEKDRIENAVRKLQVNREAERLAEEEQKRQERLAERRQELLEEPLLNALRNIQTRFADTIEGLLDGTVRGFEDVADAVKGIFFRLAAELATLQFVKATGLFDVLATGELSDLGGAFGGLASKLGFGGGSKAAAGEPIPDIDRVFGAGASAAVPGQGFDFAGLLGDAAQGAVIGLLTSSIVGKGSTGAAIGGTVGSIAGSFLPIPGGSQILGAVGSLVGSLFGKTPRAGATLGVDPTGNLAASGLFERGKGDAQVAEQLSRAVISQLEQVRDAVGGEFAPGFTIGQIGTRKKDFVFQTSVGRDKDLGDFRSTRFDTAEQAVAAAVQSALSRGVVTGLSEMSRQILRSATDINRAIEQVRIIETLPGEIEDAIRQIEDPIAFAFEELERANRDRIGQLNEFGLSTVDAERLYLLQREELIEQFTERSLGGIRALLDDLDVGPSSPFSLAQQRRTAEGRFQDLLGRAQGGDLDAVEDLAAAARDRLDIERQLNASSTAFFDVVEATRAALSPFLDPGALGIGASPAAPEPVADVMAEVGQMQAEIMTDQLDMLTQIREEIRNLGVAFRGGGGPVNFTSRNQFAIL
ncbi:MAG: hypothetical protein MI755_16285 [Sphingomonadales bacterium]|nr:hypothetical protein [Sphingomonadales bacterium]